MKATFEHRETANHARTSMLLTCGALLVLLVSVAPSCGGRSLSKTEANGDGTDSHTHWLGRCVEDEDCAEGLDCVCGVCSRSCDTEAACVALGEAPVCIEFTCASGDDESRVMALCTRECLRDEDCPTGNACENGVCTPAASFVEAGHCYELDEEACEDDLECDPRFGLPVDVEAQCYGRSAFATCAPRDGACDDAVTLAVDEAGRCWFFGSICYDPGFSYLSVSDERCPLDSNQDYPTCSGDPDSSPESRPDPSEDCEGGACDHCYELDEAACVADPRCARRMGSPVDTEAQCIEDVAFAICAPFDSGCADLETMARDAVGNCWIFGSICYDPGFAYPLGGDGDCRRGYPLCAELTPPVDGCDAIDVRDTRVDCTSTEGWYWNGSACTSVLICACEGEECERRYATRDDCDVYWAGCSGTVPSCIEARIPSGLSIADIAEDWSSEIGPEGEWIAAAWDDAFDSSIPLGGCPRVEGSGRVEACRGLRFTREGDEVLQVKLSLPVEDWEQLDVNAGDPVELRLTETEFAVRKLGTELPLIYVAASAHTWVPATWSIGPFVLRAGAPYCKRPQAFEPQCGDWVVVPRSMELLVPGASLSSESPALRGDTLTLEPLRSAEFELELGGLERARYRVVHDTSLFTGWEHPAGEQCGIFITPQMLPSLSLVRLRLD